MKILPVLSLFSVLILSGADVPPGLLFHADFDAYNVSASFAKGSPKSTNFKNPDLQLRMFPGVREKGNALRLENEFCAWRMKGNFTPAGGTVSVWVSPQTWKFSEKKFQVFFEAQQKDFRLVLYKYRDTPYVTAYLQVGKRSFTASAKTDDASWKAGSWHHVAAVWNADELRLYTDGTLPARYAPPGKVPAVSLVKFSPALRLPEAASDGFIALGNLFRGFRVDPKDATALDELKIYDRCLSASEIQAEYEKYFPSALAVKPETPPVATIPRTTRAPLVDGVIDEEEWRDATRVPLFKAYKTENHLARSETWLRMKSDAENLYLGFSTDLPNTKCNVTENDGNVYSDDSFEFFIEDAAKQELWFCVNGNGALFDAKNGNRAWNSHALAGAHRSGSKGWSAEIAIPLSALGSPKAGERRHANFWTLNFAKLPSCYWSWYGTPEAKMGDGIVIFSGIDECTGIERLGPVFNGRLDLLVTGRGASPVSARYETAEKNVNFEGNALNRAWKAELPTGRQRLYIERKDKAGNVSFRYEFSYFVNFPVALSFQAYPLRKRIDVKVDVNNAGGAVLQKIGSFRGVVKLLSPSGETLSEQAFSPQSITDVALKLPENPEAGTCSIQAEITDGVQVLTHAVPFRIPSREPYLRKVADDHTVPDPWHAVRELGNGAFSVLDREYRFNSSPFPAEMISRGSNVLASQPALSIDGAIVAWKDFRVAERFDDYVVLTGTGSASGLALPWRAELWFDGLYKLDFSLEPAAERQIRSMTLTWKVPREFGRYFMQRNREYVTIPWKKDAIATPLNLQDASWLSGVEKGMMWLPLSNANWVTDSRRPPIALKRDAGSVHVTLTMIGKRALLAKRAAYSLAFMATPGRRPPKNFRSFQMGSYLDNRSQNVQVCGWESFRDRPREDDMIALTHVMRDPAGFREKWIKPYGERGVKLFPYAQPGGISQYDAEYDYWLPTWKRMPGYIQVMRKLGFKSETHLCCGKGIADLMAWRTDRLFRDFPELGGIYYDICDVKTCANREHGCGGVDAFGKPYISSTAMQLRHYLMRIYKVAHSHGKLVFNHAHNYFNPVAHNFSDIWYPGENEVWLYGENPDYYYSEAPLEEYQCAWNPRIRGTAVIRCSQVTRVLSFMKKLAARGKELRSPEFSLRTLPSMLLHDFSTDSDWIHHGVIQKWWGIKEKLHLDEAVFHGYWFDRSAVSESKQVYVSWYELAPSSGYTRLVIAGNLGRTPAKAALKLDLKALGLEDRSLEMTELWSGRPLSGDDLKNTLIPGNHFLLIGIR